MTGSYRPPDQQQRTQPNTPPQQPTRGYTPPNAQYTQPNPSQHPTGRYTDPRQNPSSTPQQPTRGRQRRSARPRTKFGRLGCMLNPRCLLGCLGIIGVFVCVSMIGMFFVYTAYSNRVQESVDKFEAKLNALDDPSNTENFETTYIYDREGNQLYEVFGEGRRRRISIEEIPQNVIWATVSVEDDTFYDNSGVDIPSIIRSTRDYVLEGRVVSGASTISQQLVRNIAFDPEYRAEQSINRKLDEAMLALILNQKLTKDEIMELYLNQIYYGNLAYGIEAASQVYFGKPATELTLPEAAMLAGLPQSPRNLDPLNPDPTVQENVTNRQHLVLDLMVEEGYITQQQADEAKQTTLFYASPEIPLDQAQHFVVYAKDETLDILDRLGYPPEYFANGGLKVYTSINMDFQAIAENSARTTIAALRNQHDITNASVVVIHPPSGEILAMVGSVNYDDDSIDGKVNVSLAQRQPGSTMKPFTYAAAMEQGWSAGTIVWDTNVSIGIPGSDTYSPVNYDRRQHGPVRIRSALANSYNIPAVKTLRKVGVQYLIDFMHRFGVQSLNRGAENYGLSLTLGGGEVSLLEYTNAYATFARGGNYVSTHAILCIIDNKGNIVYQYENRCQNFGVGVQTGRTFNDVVVSTPVLDPRIAFIISDILADNAARTPAMGANSPLNTGSLVTSVKTGTTNDFRDNWTMGYTHDLAVGVWSGNSDNHPMVNISGLQGAAPIWRDTMLGIYAAYQFPPNILHTPEGVTQQRICNISTLRDPSTGCGSFSNEWYLNGPALVPDGQGGMTYYPQPESRYGSSEFGPQIQEIEPGIVQSYVRPIPPEQATILAAQGGSQVIPKYCLVPLEVLSSVPDATVLTFIDKPLVEDEYRGAFEYAYGAGLPILPPYACTSETISGGSTAGTNPPNVVGYITSPGAGETVSGNIPIIGVVQYPGDQQMAYYKVEVRGGPFGDWTTLGNTHGEQYATPSQLEVFQASALPPGNYELQLVIFGSLGEYKVQTPIVLAAP